MRNIRSLLTVLLLVFSIQWGQAQNQSIFGVRDSTSTFGVQLPKNTIVFDKETGNFWQLAALSPGSNTLATSGKTIITDPELLKSYGIYPTQWRSDISDSVAVLPPQWRSDISDSLTTISIPTLQNVLDAGATATASGGINITGQGPGVTITTQNSAGLFLNSQSAGGIHLNSDVGSGNINLTSAATMNLQSDNYIVLKIPSTTTEPNNGIAMYGQVSMHELSQGEKDSIIYISGDSLYTGRLPSSSTFAQLLEQDNNAGDNTIAGLRGLSSTSDFRLETERGYIDIDQQGQGFKLYNEGKLEFYSYGGENTDGIDIIEDGGGTINIHGSHNIDIKSRGSLISTNNTVIFQKENINTPYITFKIRNMQEQQTDTILYYSTDGAIFKGLAPTEDFTSTNLINNNTVAITSTDNTSSVYFGADEYAYNPAKALSAFSVTTASGGIFLNDSDGGGIYLNDKQGGGIYLNSDEGGGISLSDSDGGGISITSTDFVTISNLKLPGIGASTQDSILYIAADGTITKGLAPTGGGSTDSLVIQTPTGSGTWPSYSGITLKVDEVPNLYRIQPTTPGGPQTGGFSFFGSYPLLSASSGTNPAVNMRLSPSGMTIYREGEDTTYFEMSTSTGKVTMPDVPFVAADSLALVNKKYVDNAIQPSQPSWVVGFVLPENVSNTTAYFYSWNKSNSDSDIRSGSSQGIQHQNGASPIQVMCDATIRSAGLSLKGAGVQNATVTYPVRYRAELWAVGWDDEGTKLGDLDFMITDDYAVGDYSPDNTNVTIQLEDLDIEVPAGTMLALKFVNGTGASQVGQMRNAFISLSLQKN